MHQPLMTARCIIVLIVVLGVCASVRSDQRYADDEVARRLEQMQHELDLLREDNLAMRREVDRLRAEREDNWLTEQRSAEIRSLVQDAMADADTRASLLGSGMMAGWDRGFFLASHDSRFLLRLHGQLQVRFVYNFHERPDVPIAAEDLDRHMHGFENARTRLAFSGHVFSPDLEYYVRGGFARDRAGPADTSPRGSFQMLEAYVRYHFDNEWSLRFGQFKLPFNREFLVSSARQLGVERSVVADNLSLGWSQGVELRWWSGPWRVSGAASDGAQQLFGGQAHIATPAGFQVATIDRFVMNTAALHQGVEYAWTGRAEHLLVGTWEQFADFTSPMHDSFGVLLGAAIHAQRSAAGFAGAPRFRWYAYTVDASVEWGGANAFVAFIHQYIDNPGFNINIYGVVGQAGFYVAPKWEVFGRYEFGTWDFPAPVGSQQFLEDMHIVTVGFNYYLDGHDAKWTTDIGIALDRVTESWARPPSGGNRPTITGFRAEGAGARRQIVFRTQFQLLF